MINTKLHEIIKNRRSPVVFSDKRIEEKKIKLLFEAARWAPSSMNEQPWRFIYSSQENKESFKKIFDCLVHGNKPWNQNIPLLILVATKMNFDYKNRINEHAKYDVASAVANLTFQANFMDLWVHQMGGFDVEKAKSEFNIPEGFEPVVILSVGYFGILDNVDEKLKKRDQAERKRIALNEIVFKNTWNGR